MKKVGSLRSWQDVVVQLSRIWVPLCVVLVVGLCQRCGPITAFGAGTAAVSTAGQERGFSGAISDTEIHSKIDLKFFDYHVDLFKRLSVTVFNGCVLLTGSVPTEQAHQDALILVRQVQGIKEVYDEIRVGQPLSADIYLLDTWIANRIRTTLLVMPQVQSGNFTVDVEDKMVYLMGMAQDEAEMNRVVKVARETPDVRKVVNYIKILPPKAPQPTLNPETAMNPNGTSSSTPSGGSDSSTAAGATPSSPTGFEGAKRPDPSSVANSSVLISSSAEREQATQALANMPPPPGTPKFIE